MSQIPLFDEFWDTEVKSYGYVRHAVTHHPADHWPDVLIVFVHGILSSCRAWLDLPWHLEQSGVRADLFSYGYPAYPGLRSSVQEAADQLRTALDTSLNVPEKYRHVIFVTHSTGGLIVKEMLRRDCQRTWEELIQAARPYSDIERDSLVLRTREIFHYTVPHLGASWLLSCTALPLTSAASLLLSPLLSAVNLVTIGRFGLGHNHIASQLRLHRVFNPWIRQLDNEFEEWESRFRRQDLPWPRSHDLVATAEVSFLRVEREDDIGTVSRSFLLARGTHLSLRVPRDPNSPQIQNMIRFLRAYGNYRELALTYRTIMQTCTVDHAFGIPWIDPAFDPGAPLDLTDQDSNHLYDSQARVYRDLLDKLNGEDEQPQLFLLTGQLGVGKSRVLRRLARGLAVRYLRSLGLDPPGRLPITLPTQLVPMEQIERGNPKTGSGLLEILLRYWCDWANQNIGSNLLTYCWLRERIASQPIALLLDSIDEFIADKPTLGMEHLRRMLRHIQELRPGAGKLAVVFCVRTPQHGLPLLETMAGKPSFEVSAISVEQAIARYPALARLLLAIQSERIRGLLQTPLMLNILGPVAHEIDAGSVQDFSGLHETALTQVIRQSGLCPGPEDTSYATLPEYWLNALMLVAWRFFVEQRGFIDISEFRSNSRAEGARWEEHFATTHSPDLSGHSILDAFRLIEDDVTARQLMTRTVLLPEGLPEPRRVRFQHREWQDFLVARYLGYCIRAENIDELRHLAFTQEAFRTAGEYLRDKTIREPLVRRILALVGQPEHTNIVGNFCALLGNTQGHVEGPAVRALVEKLIEFPPIVRVVTLTGLGYWTLAKQEASAERRFALNLLPRALIDLLAPENEQRVDAVSRSLAWCHLKVLEGIPGIPSAPCAWPGLGASRRQIEDALALMSPMANGLPIDEPTPFHRSFQEACLAIQEVLLFDHHRPISAVHYLFYISVAMGHGCLIPEVAEELAQIFGSARTRYRKIYEGYERVPELLQIFDDCHALFEGRHPSLDREPAAF